MGGSTAERGLECLYSITRAADMPRPAASDAAKEGTMLHAAFVEAHAEKLREEIIGFEMEGVTLTRELYEDKLVPALEAFDAFIAAREVEFYDYELPVRFKAHPEAFGTGDLMGVNKNRTIGFVGDLKFGFHEVDVETAQLDFYAAAALETPEVEDLFDGVGLVELFIIQPGSDPVLRSRTVSTAALRHFSAKVSTALRMKDHDGLEPVAGKWCKFCPVKPVCPAHVSVSREALEIDLEGVNDLGALVDMAYKVEAWAASVLKLAHSQLEAGHEVTGYKLVPKRAYEKWTDADAALVHARERRLPLKTVTKRVLLTPTQLRKVLKSRFERVFDGYTSKQSSGTTMARAEDAREGLAITATRVKEVGAKLAGL
jgi:hypothetical protein